VDFQGGEGDIVAAESSSLVVVQDIPLLLSVIASPGNDAEVEIDPVSSTPDEPRWWWTASADGLGGGVGCVLCGSGGGDQRAAAVSYWSRTTAS
jgi:hypothetical protein